MHNSSFRTILFSSLIVLFLLLDWYVFQGVKVLVSSQSEWVKRSTYIVYWGFTAVTIILLLVFILSNPENLSSVVRNFMITFMFANLFFKLIFGLFLVIDDLTRLVRWVYAYFATPEVIAETGEGISRLKFLSVIGVTVAGLPFISMLYGVLVGAHDYTVRKIKIKIPHLPESFNGFKIVQLSDIHAGSFVSKSLVEKGVEMAKGLNPDVVFFTGDLVNNVSTEIDPYMDLFASIKAPYGVMAVLGNHDYGDYVTWDSAEKKRNNVLALIEKEKKMGWDVLMNEHRIIQKGDDAIAVIGIENWGAKGRFPKYGKMKQAYTGTEKYPVKLLLSHDPSHWDAEVREEYQDIDVMFAGHTHGFQFGIEIPGIKWSPVKYMYEQWAGLYQKGKQYLYVNRGFGYIGFPGRVGMPPEITLIELVKA
jgi:predicted MPP superfamily phosphohydrolase